MAINSKINKCPLHLRCDVRWQDLPKGAGDENVRLCTQCKEPVYLVTPAETAEHALLGHCIALADPENPRKNALHRGRMGIFRLEVPDPIPPVRARVRSVRMPVETPFEHQGSEDRVNRMADNKGFSQRVKMSSDLADIIVHALHKEKLIEQSSSFEVFLVVFDAIEAQKGPFET